MDFLDFIKNLITNNKRNARLITKDLNKTYGEKDQLEVALYENINQPIANKNILIEINDMIYTRTSDADGIARLNINLAVGEYNAFISFDDPDYNFISTYCKVKVNPIIETFDLNMREKDGAKFQAVLSDANHKKLSNVKVMFMINGVSYERISDENGVASLNINLGKGDYEIITQCNGISKKNIVHIDEEPPKPTKMEGINLTKNYGDATPYQCAVYNDEVGRVAGTVKMNINGVTYSKTPDSTGLYKLNINLKPGTYILRAEFQGNNKYASSSVENKIIINDPPKPQPKSYEQLILEDFENKFGKVTTIDGALAKVNGRGYAYYYDDKFSNNETANRVLKWLGANCTDLCQWFWHIGKALGYDVRCIHVGCRGGDGHVRLQFRHPINTGGQWINRDPAAVLSDNGQGVSYCWCLDGTTWAINPSWFMENLYR